MWISGGAESHTADLPGHALSLQCKVVGWSYGWGLRNPPKPKSSQEAAESIGCTENREGYFLIKWTSVDPPRWLLDRTVTVTVREHLLKTRAHQAMVATGIPQIGKLPRQTPAHRFRPIFFEPRPSENSGTVEWNKRPLLFI